MKNLLKPEERTRDDNPDLNMVGRKAKSIKTTKGDKLSDNV